jgi:RsiW-degrading membrane proteinase PrsW (M82 family)
VILVGVLLVAMFGAAVVGSLHRDTVALYNLAGLLFVGVVAAHTYLVVWIYRRYQEDGRQRHLLLLVATAALGVLLLVWLSVVAGVMTLTNFPEYVAALPFTLGALWVVRNLQVNRKEPWKVVLLTIAWGMMIAPDLAILAETAYSTLLGDSLIPGIGAGVAQAISPAVFEEGGKGLAVVLLFLLFRNEFDDVVSGIVLGALVGLGFNFLETGQYVAMAFQDAGLAGAIVQLGYRQVLGLLTGHVAYTALIGAGIGVARQQRVPWRKAVTIASGFLVAIAAHFVWDLVAMTGLFPSSEDPLVDFLIVTPLQYLVLDGTFALMAVTLLVLGLRQERSALEVELRAEVGTGLGAVTEPELPWLLRPRRRVAVRWRTLWRRGVRDWLWLHRLQDAQLTLAMERWHRRRQEVDEPVEAEHRLRQRVLELKRAGKENRMTWRTS